MGVWVAGAQPPASTKRKTYFVHRARRAGRRSRRARRARASAGSASRAELGKGKNRFEPGVSRIWQKQNVLAYVCDILYICFSLYYLYLVCNRAPTHGGLGCRGAAPASIKHKTYFVHQARRAGRRSRRARRAQAARSRGRAKTRCRRHALKRWFGSGKVSTDGLQGRSPPCVNQAQNLLCPPSAASGAAKPPRPQGASFRRKREPRGAGEGRNSI